MPEALPGDTAVADAQTDAVVITAFEGGWPETFAAVDSALGGALTEMRDVKEWTGKFAQRIAVRTLGRLPARRLVLLGLGKPAELDAYRLVNAFTMAGSVLRAARARSVTAYVGAEVATALAGRAASDGTMALAARDAALGLLLGNWDGGITKTEREEDEPPPDLLVERVEIAGLGTDEQTRALLREAVVLAEATNRVRTWVATPSNRLTPTQLAAEARSLLDGTGVELEVLDRSELQRLGAGALLGVAQGSEEPPVMICARWDGGRPDGPKLALVGKGITFDTGGISIKPAAHMDMMKTDMGGGAAVLGAVWAIARLGLPVNVIGVVPATENMPGGRAYKPGDVLTSMSGKTIEVLNTDAEGRIILADGMAQARAMGATHIVDAATLTGAIIVALGHVTAGLMSNDADLTAAVKAAAARAGDRVTELPLYPEYDGALTSEVADVKNIGGRAGGSITAALFIREFVGDLPWVHLDVAGTAWNEQSDLKGVPQGPTGMPVRTFVELARAFAAR